MTKLTLEVYCMSIHKKFEEKVCSCCNKQPAYAKGLCRACYARVKYRKKNGIPLDVPKYSTLHKETFNTVMSLSDVDSMSQSEIARVCGVSRQRVHTIIKKYKKESESA